METERRAAGRKMRGHWKTNVVVSRQSTAGIDLPEIRINLSCVTLQCWWHWWNEPPSAPPPSIWRKKPAKRARRKFRAIDYAHAGTKLMTPRDTGVGWCFEINSFDQYAPPWLAAHTTKSSLVQPAHFPPTLSPLHTVIKQWGAVAGRAACCLWNSAEIGEGLGNYIAINKGREGAHRTHLSFKIPGSCGNGAYVKSRFLHLPFMWFARGDIQLI